MKYILLQAGKATPEEYSWWQCKKDKGTGSRTTHCWESICALKNSVGREERAVREVEAVAADLYEIRIIY